MYCDASLGYVFFKPRSQYSEVVKQGNTACEGDVSIRKWTAMSDSIDYVCNPENTTFDDVAKKHVSHIQGFGLLASSVCKVPTDSATGRNYSKEISDAKAKITEEVQNLPAAFAELTEWLKSKEAACRDADDTLTVDTFPLLDRMIILGLCCVGQTLLNSKNICKLKIVIATLSPVPDASIL